MRILISFLLLLGVYAEAVTDSPEEVKVSTPNYEFNTGNFQPVTGTYTYDVSWASISAATIEINVDRSGDGFKVVTEAQTNPGIDVFYRLRFKAAGEMTEDFMPVSTKIFSQENSRVKKSDVQFSNGFIHAIRDNIGKRREEFNFNPNNMTLDPFSVAFLARTFDWKSGEEREFDIFNGRTRYLIKFKSIGNKVIEQNGKKINCYVIQPSVTKLNPIETGKKKLNSASIYISADQNRDILRIESDVFVGTVNTELVNFKKRTGTQVAINSNPKK